MVSSLVRFLFTCCKESQTHSLEDSLVRLNCDSSQLVYKNSTRSPTIKYSIFLSRNYLNNRGSEVRGQIC